MFNQKKTAKTATDLSQEASKLINLALDNYTSANSCLALIKYNEAIENYDKAIANYDKAIANYNEAIQSLDQVLKIEPNNLCALQDIGDAFISIGKTLHWKSVVTCDKKDNNTKITDYNNATGYYKQSIDNYNKAIEFFNTLLQHAPNTLRALQNIGDAFIGIGDALRNKKRIEKPLTKETITDEDVLEHYKNAIEKGYNKVLELDPKNPCALDGKSAALEGQGKYEEASKCYFQIAPCSKMHLPKHKTDPKPPINAPHPIIQSQTQRLFKPSSHSTLPSEDDDTASKEKDSRAIAWRFKNQAG